MVDQDIYAIDFARLYGIGLRLSNAIVAAKGEIDQRILPELEDPAREALDSLVDLHGPFILATTVGQDIIADAERYTRRPEEEAVMKEVAQDLGRGLEENPLVADPEVGKFIRETVGEIDIGENAERVASYSTGTMKNVSIVIIGGASLAAMPIIGGVVMGPPGFVAGAVALLVGSESLKKTKAFSNVTGKITEKIDELADSASDVRHMIRRFEPLRKFAINYEPQLRKMAGKNQIFNWLHRYLDWLKAQE